MKDIVLTIALLALGALFAHAAWLHGWKMYKGGKAEGRAANKEEK